MMSVENIDQVIIRLKKTTSIKWACEKYLTLELASALILFGLAVALIHIFHDKSIKQADLAAKYTDALDTNSASDILLNISKMNDSETIYETKHGNFTVKGMKEFIEKAKKEQERDMMFSDGFLALTAELGAIIGFVVVGVLIEVIWRILVIRVIWRLVLLNLYDFCRRCVR